MKNEVLSCKFALVGKTNVGKSTLLNLLLGDQIAITSHKSHTTRSKILGVVHDDPYEMIFLDTPGLGQKTHNTVQSMMMRATDSCISEADCILFLIDTAVLSEQEVNLLKKFKELKPVILVINKIDRITNDALEIILNDPPSDIVAIIPISAKKKTHIDILRGHLRMQCQPKKQKYHQDFTHDQSLEKRICEVTRCQLLKYCHKEVPHDLNVELEKYEQNEKLATIHLVIVVKNNNQKKIVIGKNGLHLKKIATDSRKSIEKILNKKVMLKVWVKINPNWMESQPNI